MSRILGGYDGSPPSRRALAWALDGARPDQKLVLATVIPEGVARSRLSDMMRPGIALPVRRREPARVFLQLVEELRSAHIVIGHKSYESAQLKLRAIAETLVRLVPATVTVVR